MRIIDYRFPLNKIKLNKYLFGLTVFVFSVNVHNPYPWYDYDAVLLFTIGYFLIFNKKSLLQLLLGLLFITIASLTKQSYYVIPIITIFGIYFLRSKRDAFYSVFILFFFYAVYIALLVKAGIFNLSMSMTWGVYNLKTLLSATIKRMLFLNVVYLIVPLLAYFVLDTFYCRMKNKLNIIVIIFILNFGITSLLISIFAEQPGTIINNYLYLLMYICLFIVIKLINTNIKLSIFLFMLLFSSATLLITWAPNLRFVFIAPLLFSFYYFIFVILKIHNPKNIYFLNFFVPFLFFFGFIIVKKNIIQSHYDISEVYSRFSSIRVEKNEKDTFMNLKALYAKYNKNVEVFPYFPLYHFINNTHSSIRIDIDNKNEVPSTDKTIRDLNSKCNYIFFQKSSYQHKSFKSKIFFMSDFVVNNWQKIDSTKYFDVYKNPNLQEN